MISIRQSPQLLQHLTSHEIDGTTVAAALFEGGRLSYPERKRIEYELGFSEPYLLEHEACVLEGMSPQWNAACRWLARLATKRAVDPTLELLWQAHDSFAYSAKDAGPQSLDRLIAALVTINDALHVTHQVSTAAGTLVRASEIVIRGLQVEGFPPSVLALEELCDGAFPACVGLGMVDIDWRNER